MFLSNKLNSIPETNMILERISREDEILNDHYQQLSKNFGNN